MFPLLSLARGAGGPGDRLVADFAAGDAPAFDAVNDGVMGGRSSGTFAIREGVLVFSGFLRTDGGGFASIRSRPRPLALAGAAGLRLRVRGDGRTYLCTLRGNDLVHEGRAVSWRAALPTAADGAWREVTLPFASFEAAWRGRPLDLPPPEPARVDSVGFMLADRRDGPFRLEVGWIRAYAMAGRDG